MSTGIGKCLADVLRADTVSVPASTFVAKYPLLFNAPSAVPTFLYTCLKDIWTQGTSASGQSWNNLVVDTYGFGAGGTRTIYVCPYRLFDAIDAPKDFFQSNTTGAEFCEVFIYMVIGGALTPADSARLTQAELRIRRLLDYNFSVNTCGHLEIPVTDLTINPQADVKAYWQGVLRGPLSDKDLAVQYYTTYTRLLLS